MREEADSHSIEIKPGKTRGEDAPPILTYGSFLRGLKVRSNNSSKIRNQRVTCKLKFTRRGSAKAWAAHGYYISREKANAGVGGFSQDEGAIDVAETLKRWHEAGDERFWRIIISPERGDHPNLDMKRLVRDVMRDMEDDLGRKIEYVACVHINTDQKHAHVCVRGNGFRIPRHYVKEGLKRRAEQRCTEQIGERTIADIVRQQETEITAERFTSLDRRLVSRSLKGQVATDTSGLAGLRLLTELNLELRLRQLEALGLAKRDSHEWSLADNLEQRLREMNRARFRKHEGREPKQEVVRGKPV